MCARPANVVNVSEVEEKDHQEGAHWGGGYKPLTPAMEDRKGQLGVNLTRLPPGHAGCPFHSHALEDEVFYILSGRGVFRYGDDICEVGPGDCLSCPAGTGIAHQLANPFDQDLVYLGMGPNHASEVCFYPDSGKVLVRSLRQVGYLREAPYMDGEPELPKIFELLK
ncbi:hypothetical protein BI347_14200 [Chromobacterium sphagni]|uniref:Cupin type-2 domain-containing protein n=1 Tax=Chromobacterium sphagni TaxID=1903179 RepID=A0A1S1X512_9NEIS|nr:cupin domain-containing protein [Chromobacterium sphagni]OHX14530.1 hypothetical protein BI347_14200 [Chromobacterium sphagni]